MKTVKDHNKCFTKHLDGKWSWAVPLWFTAGGMFADCVIKSPEGKQFDSQEDATTNMVNVLKILEIV